MRHPFRFGVQLSSLPPADWAERLRRIEAWGYDSVFWPDHFGPQWEPVAALAAAAAVTSRLKVGSLVYGIDYRHPIVLAKSAATDADALEWNALVFVTAVTDDPKPLRQALAKNGGMTVEQVAACPLYLTGPASEIRELLEQRRAQFGISYVVIQGTDEKVLGSFAEQIVAPLAGR